MLACTDFLGQRLTGVKLPCRHQYALCRHHLCPHAVTRTSMPHLPSRRV